MTTARRTTSRTQLLASSIEADQPDAANHLRYLGRQLIAAEHRLHRVRRRRDELAAAVHELMHHTNPQTIAAVTAALARVKDEDDRHTKKDTHQHRTEAPPGSHRDSPER